MALKEVFHGNHIAPTPDNILGVLSLLFWTLTVVVSVKYVLLILRADNNGEGGLIAMLALATTAVREKPTLRRGLMLVGLFGTAIFDRRHRPTGVDDDVIDADNNTGWIGQQIRVFGRFFSALLPRFSRA